MGFHIFQTNLNTDFPKFFTDGIKEDSFEGVTEISEACDCIQNKINTAMNDIKEYAEKRLKKLEKEM